MFRGDIFIARRFSAEISIGAIFYILVDLCAIIASQKAAIGILFRRFLGTRIIVFSTVYRYRLPQTRCVLMSLWSGLFSAGGDACQQQDIGLLYKNT